MTASDNLRYAQPLYIVRDGITEIDKQNPVWYALPDGLATPADLEDGRPGTWE